MTQSATQILSFEQRLKGDLSWAFGEGSLFFEGKGEIHDTLRRFVPRFNEVRVPYAVIGGLAIFAHGVRQFTGNIDILVTRDSLKIIHENLERLGCILALGSTILRDTKSGVRIGFVIAGDYRAMENLNRFHFLIPKK